MCYVLIFLQNETHLCGILDFVIAKFFMHGGDLMLKIVVET